MSNKLKDEIKVSMFVFMPELGKNRPRMQCTYTGETEGEGRVSVSG